MIDFKIRRGLSHELFPEVGKVNPRLKIEEGCWYLCTDTADLYLGVNTGEELTLKRINDKASDTPTVEPGTVDELLEVYINENGELAALYSVSGEVIIGSVVSKEYVDERISGIKVPEINLDDYAKKTDIPDVKDFVTKTELNDAISNIEHPSIDLKDYVTKDEIKYFINEIPAEYITEAELKEVIDKIEHPITDLSDYTTKDYVAATTHHNKYEVLPIDGMFIQYRDGEIRLNTQRVVPTHQNVGATGNPNMYYATFRAFAPEGATQCKEGLNGNIDAEYSALATDEYGRKYTTIWAAIASYNGTNWSLFGAGSNLNKYLGFYYHFEWYNEDTLIGTDKVRVILTNDACHDDLVPDAVARRIDDKIKAIDIPKTDLTGYATEEYVNTAISDIELPEAELYKVDFNAPDYDKAVEAYNNGKVLVLINAAPDINSYAVMNYVSERYIAFTKFLTSRSEAYGSFNTYYLSPTNTWEVSKEVKLNKVEANVSDEATAELTSLRVGKEVYKLPDLANYVTNEILEQNYITNEEIAKTYVTTEQVIEVVADEVQASVTEQIEVKVTEVIDKKIEDGNLDVKADSISYDTW